MNKTTNNHLVDIRAKALLTVSLTSRNDLALSELDEDSGFDLIVRILKNGSISNRMFGVVLKAAVREQAGYSISLSKDAIANYKDVPFPICLFFFYMTDDRGYYKWLVEPRFSALGKPDLGVSVKSNPPDLNNALIDPHDLTELTPESLGELIDSVNAWYDAR